MNLKVNRSKSGLPTLTENGGGATNTGWATIITSADGFPVKPLFVPRGYAQGDHAIVVVKPGMLIFNAAHSRRGESVKVERIVSIMPDGTDEDENANIVITETVGEYEDGDSDLPEAFDAAVKAALSKSHCYHCREPHYIEQ